MSITWNDYQQQALTTAIYPLKRELEYTVLGLCSEVGEVGVAYVKSLGAWGTTQGQAEDLLKEIGDVYWYVAAVADALNCPLQHIWDHYSAGIPVLPSAEHTLFALGGSSADVAGFVKKAIRDNDGFLTMAAADEIRWRLGAILIQLQALAVNYGSTPEAVMSKNLNKLADRKQRGVLQGSGDNR